jgi:ATP-dependent RNA helicase DeaD
MTLFSDLELRPELLSALSGLGYEEPTPIQRDAIPQVLAGRDVLGQAATGTGKTAAFALPALQLVDGPAGAPLVLVLVPTRELAVQVSEACYRYGRSVDAKVVPVYGGQPIFRQLGALRDGVHIVVATPGRAIDHINRGTLSLDAVRLVVLDEADEMLDMGFAEDIEAILTATPDERQTVLFSATMPPRIERIARRFMRDPVRIEIERTAADAGAPRLITERAFVVTRAHKAAALGRILDVEAPAAAIVFCRTRTEVDELTETLNGRGYRAEALHGGMNQEGRDRVMGRLRTGTAELLIATDVAARGLDVDILTHVVNYDVPSAPDAYVHRIGRVGRAGRAGVAITLAEPRELRLLTNIERATKRQIPVEQVPSVAELRSRQLDATASAVQGALAADDLERFAPVLERLAADSDVRTVALAALKVTHEARTSENDEVDIPEFVPRDKRDRGDWAAKGDRRERSFDRSDRPPRRDAPGKPGGRFQAPPGSKTRLFINLGRKDRIRPGDLVGAIANESELTGKDIGPINVTETFSTVDVPAASADAVIDAIKRTTIRGKRANIRRDRGPR